MPVERKVVPAAFSTGIDGKDPKLVAQGLLRLENCIVPRAGALTLRNGTKILDNAGAPFTEPYVASYKGEACLVDTEVKMAEGETPATSTMKTMDTLERWKTDHTKLEVASGRVPHMCEVIEIGKIRLWTYMEYNSVGSTYDLIVEAYSKDSGRLLNKTIVYAAAGYDHSYPRLVPATDDSALWLLYVNTASLYWCEINIDTGVPAAAAAAAGGLTNNQQMDAVAISETEIIAGCCGADLTLVYIDTGGPTYDTQVIATTGNCDSVGVWKRPGDAHACIGYFDDTDLDLRLVVYKYDAGLSAVMAPKDIRNLGSGAIVNITGIGASSTACYLYTSEVSGSPLNQPVAYQGYVVIPGGTGITNTQLIRRSLVASKPWIPSGETNHFLWVTYDAGKCAFLVDASGNVCGKLMPESMDGHKSITTPGGTVDVDSGDPCAFIALTHTRALSGVSYYTTCLRRYDTREASAVGDTSIPMMVETLRTPDLQMLEAQDVLLIGGSVPTLFDGKSIVEQGFFHTPEAPAGSAGGAGGSLGVGKYYGAITYRWRDQYGRLHESAPSGMTEVSPAAGEKITWTIPYLSHTLKPHAQVCMWRSKVDQNVLYLRQTWENSKIADNLAGGLVDGNADSTLTGKEQIYTRSTPATILENIQPPQSHVQCIHQNRHFVVDDEYPATRVRYTKEGSPTLGFEHSDSLVLTVPPSGGDITALASDVDRLLVFKQHQIYYFAGSGLDIQGAGLGYQGPRVASDNKGCRGPRLLAVTDLGVVFCGFDRIYLLGKRLQVDPIGESVRYYTEPESPGAVTPKSMVHLPAKNLLIVMTDGAALVLDLLHGVWGTWTLHQCTDACAFGDLLLFKYPTGNTLRYEAEGSWQDPDGNIVTPVIETGIFQFAGLGGVEFVDNVLIYAYCLASHKLHVAFQYDGEPHGWLDEQLFDASTFQTFTEAAYFGGEHVNYRDNEYVLDAEVGQDQCAGLRMKIWISNHTGLVKPIDLVGLAFRLGVTDRLRLVGGAREIPLAP